MRAPCLQFFIPDEINPPPQLEEIIQEDHKPRLVEDGIYSALENSAHKHLYDRRATLYDLVVGTRLYNRVM